MLVAQPPCLFEVPIDRCIDTGGPLDGFGDHGAQAVTVFGHQQRQRLDVADGDAGMGLAGRREVVLDADVHLEPPRPEPGAASGAKPFGLVHLGQPHRRDPELAHRLLAPCGTRQLDVVQAHLHETKLS